MTACSIESWLLLPHSKEQSLHSSTAGGDHTKFWEWRAENHGDSTLGSLELAF